jgi:hypothetical protein
MNVAYSISRFIVLTIFLTSVPASVFADNIRDQYAPPSLDFHPAAPFPSDYAYTHHHDSTAVGNFLRGWAAVIHARGSYLLSYSQAAVLYEYARSLNLHNRICHTEYRVANRARIENDRKARTAKKRAVNEATRVARYANAYGLAASGLNRATGEICWPEVLRTADFVDERRAVEIIFHRKATEGACGGQSIELSRSTKSARAKLRRLLGEMPRNEYIDAHKFLLGLEHDHEFAAAGELKLASTATAKD